MIGNAVSEALRKKESAKALLLVEYRNFASWQDDPKKGSTKSDYSSSRPVVLTLKGFLKILKHGQKTISAKQHAHNVRKSTQKSNPSCYPQLPPLKTKVKLNSKTYFLSKKILSFNLWVCYVKIKLSENYE